MNIRRLTGIAIWVLPLAGLLALLLFWVSENGEKIGERRFERDQWLWRDSVSWDYACDGNAAPKDLLLTLETTEAYDYRNIYVRLWTEQPDTTPQASLHNLILADVEGYWYAKPNLWGTHYRFEAPIASGIRLKPDQKLRFTLVQYLRGDTLKGVRSAGLKWRDSEAGQD